MVEGETTQEPEAPEGAAPTPEAQPAPETETAQAESAPAEAAAVEATAVEAAAGPTLDFAHLRGFQSVEAAPAELAAREDYADELAKELAARAARFARSVDESIVLSSEGVMRWLGEPVARVVGGDDLLHPRAVLLADEALAGEDRAAVETRVTLWLSAHIRKVLGALLALTEAQDLPDAAKTLAGKISEALGVLDRERVRNEVRALDQNARGALRKLGVRFGSLYIYMPLLLKPAARGLCVLLWTLKRGTETGADRLLAFASAGRTSFANEGLLSPDAYRVAGFRLCGERVVRVDIIERLSDLIRAALPDHMRQGSRPATEAYGFLISPQMTSLTGCSGEAFASILRSLNFEPTKVSKAAFEAANRRAPTEPIKPAAPEETASAEAVEPSGDAVEPEAAAEREAQAEAAPEPSEEAQAEAEADAMAVEPAAEVEAEAVAIEPVEEPAAEAETPVEAAASEAQETPEAVEAPAESETAVEAVAAAEDAPSAEGAAEAPVAAEEIEVWRPAPRRPRAPPRPQGAEREQRQPHHAKPHQHRRQTQAPVRPEGEAVEAKPAQGPRPPRPERRDEGQRRFEGRPKEERNREERRPQKDFPPRREQRPADPDSPFAKLAALKPLLERRDKRP